MNITKTDTWIFFTNENSKNLDVLKIGKWMIFFSESSREFIIEICKKAVDENIISEAKVAITGDVACFYLNIDDIDCHKKCIYFMIENGLIRKTKEGKFYNLSFKKDTQTLSGEYGVAFIPKLKLEDFIDLYTGKWIFSDHIIEVNFNEYCQYYLETLKETHLSYLEKIEKSSAIDESKKRELRRNEYERYNNEIHICQICQNAYKKINIIEAKEIIVTVSDRKGMPIFTSICDKRPLDLLRSYFGKKRYKKKVSAIKLRKKTKRLYNPIFDISKATDIRSSSIEKYLAKDCTISILNIALIASVLKCSIEELVE